VNGCLLSLDFEQGDLFETTACNISMSRNKNIKKKYVSFDLINKQKRKIIEEASRIIREDVENITQLNSNKLDVC
jgi:methylthioribose-1-phosphate isomerase